ncbi:hypothetical protein M0811_03343 [Anaeramoeba ignava]|uniref:Uncharacterized protein n=1 Tax=Anaeramoeba ignava TaxID=1746090 RepID=A0A9Q0R4J5_ANAIG|nr:hypothetical protein M0811_03343 [Anaeramoeba ignava]
MFNLQIQGTILPENLDNLIQFIRKSHQKFEIICQNDLALRFLIDLKNEEEIQLISLKKIMRMNCDFEQKKIVY